MFVRINLKKLPFYKSKSTDNNPHTPVPEMQNKIPKGILVFFLFIAAISTYSVMRDLNTYNNFKPFGVIQDIFAQVTGSTTASAIPGVRLNPDTTQIIDSYGRCQVINPTSKRPVRTVAESGSSAFELRNKGGINQGGIDETDKIMTYTKNNNMTISYNLFLSSRPSDAGGLVTSIQKANDEGWLPTVRLCFPSGCEFNLSANADSVINFYRDINNQLAGTDNQFIGLVGPNEPGTAGEMQAFGINDYPTVVARANEAAAALQEFRVDNGGNMYLAPFALNLTNRTPTNDDTLNLLYNGSQLKPELFDFMFGNTYNIGGNLADYYYTEVVGGQGSARDYVVKNELYMILSEFGYFPDTPGLDKLEKAYNTLCNDETVDGIMFFRPSHPELETSPPRQDPPISGKDVAKIIDGCDAEPQKTSSRKSSWLNCNFDSCVEKTKSYTSGSVATPQALCNEEGGRIPEDPSKDSKAWLKIGCSGQSCKYSQKNYTQVWLPIKSLGSTTITNSSLTKSHIPACVEVSKIFNDPNHDALNQFAGLLTAPGGKTYPMPWLGSLINCISELAKASTDFAGDPSVRMNPVPLSYPQRSRAEAESDFERGLASNVLNVDPLNPYAYTDPKTDQSYIPDEKTICLKDEVSGEEVCVDNTLELISAFRQYDPFSTPSNYYQANVCSTKEPFTYSKNNEELLPGPEVELSENTTNVSGSELCWMYGHRETSDELSENFRTKNEIVCEVNKSDEAIYDKNVFEVRFPPVTGPVIRTEERITYCRDVIDDAVLQSEDFHDGLLESFKNDDKLKGCFIYQQNGDDLLEYATENYGSQTSYNITGIYDALYQIYQRIQNRMSARNLQIMFNQNIGWKTFVDNIVRDGTRDASQEAGVSLGEYRYIGEYDPNTCQEVKFFDNSISKARGTASTRKEFYYNWLGYLDIIQEWLVAYTKNTTLPAEEYEKNPFYIEDSTQAISEDERILLPASLKTIQSNNSPDLNAANATSTPLYTCDQIEICKVYSQDEVYQKLLNDQRYRMMDEEDVNNDGESDLREFAKTLCPFKFKVPTDAQATCIAPINDVQTENKMKDFLCNQGYSVAEGCTALQCSATPDGAPAPTGGPATTTIQSLSQLKPGLVSLMEEIEETMCLNPGMIIATLEREITSGVANLTGDPMEQVYPRRGDAVAWGPAQFADIAWIGTGFGRLDSIYFSGSPTFRNYTQKCLDTLGISYSISNTALFEDVSRKVLDRTYVGYALCGMAAKLKFDSNTQDKCNNWTDEEIKRAASRYLGDCTQYGREYCSIFTQTICNTYFNQNLELCGGGAPSGLACEDPGGLNDPLCSDNRIRLLHPLKDGALTATISQPYGGSRGHSGIDYSATQGTPVYAGAPGTVLRLQKNWSPCPPNATESEKLTCDAGNFVVLRHRSGLNTFWTSYQHLQSVSVNLGDTLNAGQLLGFTGNTGNSTGPHLHFELRTTDCYDGYGAAPLGTCSKDPSPHILSEEEFRKCGTVGGDSLITGDFACPIQDPVGVNARIYQDSNGVSFTGASGGSHSAAVQSLYHQHEQLPTDIRAPNATVVAPVDGTVKNIVTPPETVERFGADICDGIGLPDGNSANDANPNQAIINNLNLRPCNDPQYSGKYCSQSGSYVYDPLIDDEGAPFYDGGLVVEIEDEDGNLWRHVHMENLQVQEGQQVTRGETVLGNVYDGQMTGEWADYSTRPKDGSGCMDVTNAHLHFAIISANAVDAQYFAGNTIDSTPWVREYCKIDFDGPID
jgi:murein DD-endopeptidase MepM/ murein hydrolase activator NlpD